MSALTYNSTSLPLDANASLSLMPIYDFVMAFKYPVDKLYIDKFWDGINKDMWIVVDYDMLRWIGYVAARDTDNKKKYVRMLTDNFIRSTDYDMISGSDPRVCDLNVTNLGTPTASDTVSKSASRKGDHVVPLKNTIIVRSKVFKKTLMMNQTERAATIRDYYLLVEEIMMDYMRYTNVVSDHNSALTQSKLNAELELYKNRVEKVEFDVSPKVLEMTEYVYVLTSKRYYRKHMFKIGKTVDCKSRLSTYNTGSAFGEDDMFYICEIPTFDGRGLEKLLHAALNNYHHHREWYQIPHRRLICLLKLINAQQTTLFNVISDQLSISIADPESLSLSEFQCELVAPIEKKSATPIIDNQTEEKAAAPVEEDVPPSEEKFATPIIDDVDNQTEENAAAPAKSSLTCEKCGKIYLSRVPYTKHIAICKGNKCALCGRMFSSTYDYAVHMNRKIKCNVSLLVVDDVVTEERPYQCEACKRTFMSKARHTNHTKDGCLYQQTCSQCSKCFRSKHALQKHSMICNVAAEAPPAPAPPVAAEAPPVDIKLLKTLTGSYRCSRCMKKFVNQSCGSVHVKNKQCLN